MARKIVITSGKGGVGKTTITANLGAKLAALGLRVVLVDLDLGLNNLDVVMGIENKVVFDIIDCIQNRCRIKQALINDRHNPSLYVLPSCHSYDKSCVSGQNIKIIIDKLAGVFDYILLDCPAGIEVGFHRAVSVADEAIVVTTPHISSIRDADKVISILQNYEIDILNLVVNRVRGDLVLSGDMMDVEEIFAALKINPIGIVPDDDCVSLTCAVGGIIDVPCGANTAFATLADNLHNGKNLIYDYKGFYTGFLGRIRRGLKRKI
jgi:septum site-determining protein MinD